jgi:tRNA A37 threonylcarbamoyladenosine synthetase subunit TsaC/SUA5/YrdC
VAALPGVAVVIDGGPCATGASTVVDANGPEPKVLREGAIRASEIS